MATYNLTAGNDVLTGTADADTFDGVVNGVTGGTDALNGGGGNDTFIVGENSLGTINGGDGVDTIVLQSSDPNFPSTPSLPAVSNTEILDLRVDYARFTASQLSAFGTITNTSNPEAQLWFGLIGSGGTIDFSARVMGNHSVWVEALNAVGVSGGFSIIGTSNADVLLGSSFNDNLNGGGGDDLIGGGFGSADTLIGGAGNDRFYIQSGSGTVDGGTGVDTVLGSDLGSVVFTNVEVLEVDFPVEASISQLSSFATLVNTAPDSAFLQLKLTGPAGAIDFSAKDTGGSGVSTGGDGSWIIVGTANADELWGGSQSQRLEGGAGNDSILGGGGVDTLIGGAGDDRFIFSYLSYPVTASGTVDGGTGADTVELQHNTLGSVAFTGVENLVIHDPNWIVATIAQLNSFATITKFEIELGEGFFFQLTGSGGGTIDFSTRVSVGHGVNVTGEEVSGTYNVVGTASADSLKGNSAANEFSGGSGGDNIDGGDGIDTASYAKSASGVTINLATNIHSGGDAQGDSLVGIENVIGSNFADVLAGNGGNNRLAGGLGNDTYYIGNAGDGIVEAIGGGTDTARSYINWTLGANVERLELQGSSNLNGTGNVLNNTLVGNGGNNLLNGGAGNDYMVGSAGNDIFVVDSAGDSTVENAGGGTDTVRSFVNWTLANNVERLELQGASNLNGAGNTVNNTLVGNAGNNLLNGGAGNDYMVGSVGNDIFVVDSAGDSTVENAAGGTDTVHSHINWTLGANVERLELQGTSNLNGAGNTVDNTLVGNAGNNLLNGGAGNDYMVGGAGDDIFVVDSAGDSTVENAGAGTDTVRSYINWTLASNVERLELQGTGNLNGAGNMVDNTLVGNSGNNVLNGGAGNDYMAGGAGRDSLNGGTGNDIFDFDAVSDSPAGPALRDSIVGGFSHGFDRIDLATIDANSLVGGDQAFSFVGSAAFTGVAGQLRYTNYSGNVIIDADVNGDSTADMQILVAGTHWMTGTDFIV